MTKLPFAIRFICLTFSYFCIQNNFTMSQEQPRAVKKDKILTIHGHERHDPYFWMNQRDSKEVLDYISLENQYTDKYFAPLEPLQETLLQEFDNRIDPNDRNSPFFLQGRQFQNQNVAGKDYEQIVLIDGKSKETVFFDQNERAKGKSYYDLGDWYPSTNNKLLAFSEDHTGRRKYTIFFRDEKTGKLLKDQIKETDGTMTWANDNQTVFYVKKDPNTLREFQVYRHKLGTDSKNDELVFEEKDERFYVHISKTITDKYICINSQSSTTSEIMLINANYPEGDALIFLPRKSGHLYELDHHEKGFYVLSNENAPNKKIVFYANWPKETKPVEIIPHDDKKLIEHMLILENHLVVQQRINGLQQIEVRNNIENTIDYVQFPEETYATGLTFNEDYHASAVFLSYTSLSTPATIFKYDLGKKDKTAFFQKKLIDPAFSPSNYVTKRVWATANDGTKIAVSMIYKKGIDPAKAPMLLYGYGSYGITIQPTFSALRLSLVDRGFVFAIAHIRGGKYLGENWYENGKFQKKKNTFTDFINAAEYLGKQGYCDPEKIYAQGGSAGGLLMGAVANMAPYLWKGIVAQVPFVDVVTTMLDDSIPLTVGEYEEWGNPNEAEFYWYMLNYSPYDNVKKMDYPSMYITTGYHDSQVQYWEPLKWVAKLRDLKTNDKPLLFDCNMDAGHGGGSGRSNERLEVAREFAFILNLEGIEK